MNSITPLLVLPMLLAVSTHAPGQPNDRTLETFAPLISVVRGAVRLHIESGKGCPPWVTLAKTASDASTYKDFGFDEEMVNRLDGASNARIGPTIARAAEKGGYKMSVLGRCGADMNVAGRKLGVIELTLEQVGRRPVMLKFPYELSPEGRVVYHRDKASYGPTSPVIFPMPDKSP